MLGALVAAKHLAQALQARRCSKAHLDDKGRMICPSCLAHLLRGADVALRCFAHGAVADLLVGSGKRPRLQILG